MRGLQTVGWVLLGAALAGGGWTAAATSQAQVRQPAVFGNVDLRLREAQPPFFPVAVGESVTLFYESTGADDRACTIETIVGEFVKCAGESKEREYWRNLRTARGIQKQKRP